jgi:hypothetical protein
VAGERRGKTRVSLPARPLAAGLSPLRYCEWKLELPACFTNLANEPWRRSVLLPPCPFGLSL